LSSSGFSAFTIPSVSASSQIGVSFIIVSVAALLVSRMIVFLKSISLPRHPPSCPCRTPGRTTQAHRGAPSQPHPATLRIGLRRTASVSTPPSRIHVARRRTFNVETVCASWNSDILMVICSVRRHTRRRSAIAVSVFPTPLAYQQKHSTGLTGSSRFAREVSILCASPQCIILPDDRFFRCSSSLSTCQSHCEPFCQRNSRPCRNYSPTICASTETRIMPFSPVACQAQTRSCSTQQRFGRSSGAAPSSFFGASSFHAARGSSQ